MTGRRVLVIGCRPDSLGQAIADVVQDHAMGSLFGAPVYRTDVQASEECLEMDVTSRGSIVRMLEEVEPTDVVCCAGINLPDGENMRPFLQQFEVNAYGPLMVLQEFIDWGYRTHVPVPSAGFNFVAISSNSAHIARSESAGYCASKAALSMGLRCMARSLIKRTSDIKAWGYEPGWIDGTLMSAEALDRMASWRGEPHRIPGGRGLNKNWLARRIVGDLAEANHSMNGCMIRIDGGEQ